jgi:RNA polymerase sigma-70 factor (ECF subfamily)
VCQVPPPTPEAGSFATTEWSLVLRARGSDPAARTALAALCRQYWFPVYAYLRRQTGSPDRAEDLTQGFFAHLLATDALAHVDPARGRFRSFLLACCQNFLVNEADRAAALKRGGGHTILPLDGADDRYRREPADHLTPERLYARQWALTLLDAVLTELEAEQTAAGQRALFTALRPMLTAAADGPRYADIAREHGLTEVAVKKAAQRLRERYGALLRRRIAATLSDPAELDDEIRGLFAALAG